MSEKTIVYRGMTADELHEAYNVFNTKLDPFSWLTANRERAERIRDELKPIRDLAYGSESLQRFDIYQPSSSSNAPVLVDIHGGGWTMGSKAPAAIKAPGVLERGFVYVPIDYGLAPNSSMREIVHHVRLALSWIYQNIEEFGGDPQKLLISGNSAGAHLAATALMPSWHSDYHLPEQVIKGAILVSGVYDLEATYHSSGEPQASLKLTLENARAYSPLHHLPKEGLPVIIAYGEDELPAFKHESRTYASALSSCGCRVQMIPVPNACHFSMINELGNREGKLYGAFACTEWELD